MKRKMSKSQAKKHHPFCVVEYDKGFPYWSCCCNLLNAYDRWIKEVVDG